MPFFVGIDVSTTATKAVLMDAEGAVVDSAATTYPFDTPRPQWSEQDPSVWWNGAVHSIRAVLSASGVSGKDVSAVGLTGQMHGLVLLDDAGAVLRPSILWNDQRTAAECEEIVERIGRAELIRITGNDALTGFTAPKLLWVRNHEPEVFSRTRHVLLPKDYVRFRLTGEFATDKAGAAGTLLMDLRRREWSGEILTRLELPAEWFPATYEGPEITGELSAAGADETGLQAGTPVVAGGGDQSAQAVGVGAVREGIAALTLGTSGVVFASTNEPFIDARGRLHSFCHAVPERWHLMGVMLSAAGSLRWYRDAFAPGAAFDDLLAPAADIQPGSEGLIFLPYLTGERTPHADPTARGAFIGMTVRHTQAHLTRAVLEGVAFGLRDSFEIMNEAGVPSFRQVRLSGGGARSPLWRKILASVLDTDLATVNSTEGAALGAALLAGVGAGHWPDVLAACDAVVSITGETRADPDEVEGYEHYFRLYDGLYPALRSSFSRLAELD